jgi:hypothetical protein
VAGYIPIALTKSNKGWHKLWFYLKNDVVAPLPVFSGHLIEEVPPEWGYGPVEKEKRRLHDLIDAVVLLRTGGVHGAGVVEKLVALKGAGLRGMQLQLLEGLDDGVKAGRARRLNGGRCPC